MHPRSEFVTAVIAQATACFTSETIEVAAKHDEYEQYRVSDPFAFSYQRHRGTLPDKKRRERNTEIEGIKKRWESKSDYVGYDANEIISTPFIAAEGPDTQDAWMSLLENINKDPLIARIIALGVNFREYTWGIDTPFDFCPYFLQKDGDHSKQDKIEPAEEKESKQAPFQVKVQRTKGTFFTWGHNTDAINEIYESKIAFTPTKEAKKIAPRVLEATAIPIDDMCPLRFTKRSNNARYEINIKDLWELFKKTQDGKKTIIHCAGGKGRTGHIIATFEFLRNFHEIFFNKTEGVAVAKIYEIVANIRAKRPALISTNLQFELALKNAVALYRYALSNDKKNLMKFVHPTADLLAHYIETREKEDDHISIWSRATGIDKTVKLSVARKIYGYMQPEGKAKGKSEPLKPQHIKATEDNRLADILAGFAKLPAEFEAEKAAVLSHSKGKKPQNRK